MYALEPGAGGRAEERAAVVRFFLEEAKAGRIRLAASTLAWTECLAGPLRAQASDKADAFRNALSDGSVVALEPVDVSVAEEAARLLSLPAAPGFADAFHLATAAALGAAAALTNDGGWEAARTAAARSRPSVRAERYRRLRILLVDELAFNL
jgi:predicted nucleic acid-binding protein